MYLLQSTIPQFDPSIAEEFGYAVNNGASILGIPIFQADSFLHLIIRFAFNLLVSWLIVHFFYYKRNGRKDYYLTYMLFSSVMFLMIFLMESVKLEMGFALGLFAIFGVIRYRTEQVPVREMTYLFIIIALAVVNGLSLDISYVELITANALVAAMVWLTEIIGSRQKTSTKIVLYDKIDLIRPEQGEELKADLEKRLGLTNIVGIEVGHVDFLKDSAYLKVQYLLDKGKTNTIDQAIKIKNYEG